MLHRQGRRREGMGREEKAEACIFTNSCSLSLDLVSEFTQAAISIARPIAVRIRGATSNPSAVFTLPLSALSMGTLPSTNVHKNSAATRLRAGHFTANGGEEGPGVHVGATLV